MHAETRPRARIPLAYTMHRFLCTDVRHFSPRSVASETAPNISPLSKCFDPRLDKTSSRRRVFNLPTGNQADTRPTTSDRYRMRLRRSNSAIMVVSHEQIRASHDEPLQPSTGDGLVRPKSSTNVVAAAVHGHTHSQLRSRAVILSPRAEGEHESQPANHHCVFDTNAHVEHTFWPIGRHRHRHPAHGGGPPSPPEPGRALDSPRHGTSRRTPASPSRSSGHRNPEQTLKIHLPRY